VVSGKRKPSQIRMLKFLGFSLATGH